MIKISHTRVGMKKNTHAHNLRTSNTAKHATRKTEHVLHTNNLSDRILEQKKKIRQLHYP